MTLPAQFSTVERIRNSVPANRDEIRMLCVSTLEPRKNHARLLEAFKHVVARRPDISLRLILVGKAYEEGDHIAEEIEAATRILPIEWRRIATDEALALEYELAHFTIYPSLMEGFGLPIMESLWFGRPCLCASFGVMQELAAGGGCLTVDVTDVQQISHAIERLATDAEISYMIGCVARR